MAARAHSPSALPLYIAYGVLLALLAATVVVARFDLGSWSAVVALAIAGAKALVIAACFMHVRHSPPLIRVVICAGLFGLAILFTLSLSDYWARAWLPLPAGITNAASERETP